MLKHSSGAVVTLTSSNQATFPTNTLSSEADAQYDYYAKNDLVEHKLGTLTIRWKSCESSFVGAPTITSIGNIEPSLLVDYRDEPHKYVYGATILPMFDWPGAPLVTGTSLRYCQVDTAELRAQKIVLKFYHFIMAGNAIVSLFLAGLL